MKKILGCTALVTALLLASPQARAETTDAALDALKKQLQEMQEQMQQMQRKIEALEAQKTAVPATTTVPTAPAAAWSPSQPITLARSGANYLNMSFDTLVNFGWSSKADVSQLQLGDHDPSQRGFSLRNAEISLDGAVDPYFKAFGNIVLKLDNHNETEIELEEAYVLSTSLPANLQVKAGQFFAEFGRQNATHPHTWAFVDEPLVMGRLLGGDGLRNVGARLSWLAPTPFYTEFLLGVFNGGGGTTFSFRDPDNTYGRTPVDRGLRGPQDLLFVPRLQTR